MGIPKIHGMCLGRGRFSWLGISCQNANEDLTSSRKYGNRWWEGKCQRATNIDGKELGQLGGESKGENRNKKKKKKKKKKKGTSKSGLKASSIVNRLREAWHPGPSSHQLCLWGTMLQMVQSVWQRSDIGLAAAKVVLGLAAARVRLMDGPAAGHVVVKLVQLVVGTGAAQEVAAVPVQSVEGLAVAVVRE
jgi:hypothetical protein